jgi:hypothetical protein
LVSQLSAASKNMSRRSYYNPIGVPGSTQLAERVWQTESDVANMRHVNAGSASTRRVNAAQGEDLSQRFDPFGNNKFSDAANPWAAFFGAPTAPWKTASYDKYDRNNYNLPEAYNGQNEYLGRTIDNLIYSDETFYTQVPLGLALPLFLILTCPLSPSPFPSHH